MAPGSKYIASHDLKNKHFTVNAMKALSGSLGSEGTSVVASAPHTWGREGTRHRCVCREGRMGRDGKGWGSPFYASSQHLLTPLSLPLFLYLSHLHLPLHSPTPSRMERISSGTACFCTLGNPVAPPLVTKASEVLLNPSWGKLGHEHGWQEPYRFWPGVGLGLAERSCV